MSASAGPPAMDLQGPGPSRRQPWPARPCLSICLRSSFVTALGVTPVTREGLLTCTANLSLRKAYIFRTASLVMGEHILSDKAFL